MTAELQADRDCYRAIVLCDEGTELLAVRSVGGLALPSVEIPRLQRVAVNLTDAMTKRWGCEAICLFAPKVDFPGPTNTYWHLMEYLRSTETRDSEAFWVPISSLSETSFSDGLDYRALTKTLRQLLQPPDAVSGPFGRLGWFRELRSWVKEVIRPAGLDLTGKFCQLNASPSFSLIRFETNSGALWFKAVGDPNEHEYWITMTLTRKFPRYLPIILACRPACSGWLMKDGGTSLAESVPSLGQWCNIAAALACLQLDSIGHSHDLLGTGATDLQIQTLLVLVDPFLEAMNVLMAQQVKTSPQPLSWEQLCELGVRLKEALAALDRIDFPVTLGHGDFNPGNVLLHNNRPLFIDWAGAHVGHPFFTLEYLLACLRKSCPTIARFEALIRGAHARQFLCVVSTQSITQASVLSPLIALFAYAVTSWKRGSVDNPQLACYLRSLTRRMKYEVGLLDARGTTCLQF